MWSVRLAKQSDADGCVKVVKSVYDEYGFGWFPETYHADLYDLQTYYLDNGNPFWVAESDDGTIIGTVSLEYFEPMQAGSGLVMVDGYERVAGADCALNRLYVSPSCRRGGVGKALTEAVIAEAKRNGSKRLELWSDKRFEKAHQLYQSYGAEIVGDRICHDPENSPEWGLRLNL